jgi:hypothetical protein
MRCNRVSLFVALFAAQVFGQHAFSQAVERLIPAGSLLPCTIAEPKLSSKTENLGDPIMCQMGYSQAYGRSVLPYDSYMVGRFEEYKDPGHFVGKGWMQLTFDRIVIEPDTVIPINARVVDVPGYRVDRQGRILGKGHAVRDVVEWSIPILWPIDVVNLPRRGPRPTLKRETRLTLKMMDDLAIPAPQPLQQDPYGLFHRPAAYEVPPAQVTHPKAAAVTYVSLRPIPSAPVTASEEAVDANETPKRPPYTGEGARPAVTLIFKDGRPPQQAYNYMLTATTLYVLDDGRQTIPLRDLDLAAMGDANREAGIDFRVPVTVYGQ